MSEREKLLKRVQECDFILSETALFLDVNPANQEALAHYRKHQALRRDAAEKYTKKYGPITHMDYDGDDRWSWTMNPWPWQNMQEV